MPQIICEEKKEENMNLNDAEAGKEYVITKVDTGGDEEMESFLFSLGCYSGEKITVVDKKKNLVVALLTGMLQRRAYHRSRQKKKPCSIHKGRKI